MPLEVRQIGIHMAVGDVGEAGGKDRDRDEDVVLGLLRHDDDGRERARLIEQCIEAVLAELARRSER